MKKIRMLLPTGAVIGMLVVGTAFPAMAAADRSIKNGRTCRQLLHSDT